MRAQNMLSAHAMERDRKPFFLCMGMRWWRDPRALGLVIATTLGCGGTTRGGVDGGEDAGGRETDGAASENVTQADGTLLSDGATPDSEPARPDPVGYVDADFESIRARWTSSLEANQVAGGALAVVTFADQIESAAFGVRDTRTGQPVTDNTVFQIASITKTLTALTALRLAERGVVDLDAPFESLVPFVNSRAPYTRAFTLAELLQHRAGYPTELPGGAAYELEARFRGNADLLLWSEPGWVFNYSNEGYALAGLSLVRATNVPFAELVAREVLTPAGMSQSTLDIERVVSHGDVSAGHSSYAGVLGPADHYYGAPWYGPMGGAWCTARDLAALAKLLLLRGDGLVAGASFERMLARPPRESRDSSYYGLGIQVEQRSGMTVLSHSGSVGGFLSIMTIVPELGFAMVSLVNSDSYVPFDLHDQVLAELGARYSAPAPWMPTEAELDEYVGTYTDQAVFGDVTITRAGRTFSAQISRLGQTWELELFYRDVFSFYFPRDQYDYYGQFVRGEDGRPRFFATPVGVAER